MITVEILKAIYPFTPTGRLALFVEPLAAAMDEFEINTPARQMAFLAQVGHESNGFVWMEELASGAAYDNRADLGNTFDEAVAIAKKNGTTAGRFFKGHGPIQVTGYENHCKARDRLGIDCVENPKLLTEPIHGLRAAGDFWKTHGLNELADSGDHRSITRRINGACTDGPPSHHLERMTILGRAEQAFRAAGLI